MRKFTVYSLRFTVKAFRAAFGPPCPIYSKFNKRPFLETGGNHLNSNVSWQQGIGESTERSENTLKKGLLFLLNGVDQVGAAVHSGFTLEQETSVQLVTEPENVDGFEQPHTVLDVEAG